MTPTPVPAQTPVPQTPVPQQIYQPSYEQNYQEYYPEESTEAYAPYDPYQDGGYEVIEYPQNPAPTVQENIGEITLNIPNQVQEITETQPETETQTQTDYQPNTEQTGSSDNTDVTTLLPPVDITEAHMGETFAIA